jgi:hypothetical protein
MIRYCEPILSRLRMPRPPRLSSIGAPKVGVAAVKKSLRRTGTISALARAAVGTCGARKPNHSQLSSGETVSPSMEKPSTRSGGRPVVEAWKP